MSFLGDNASQAHSSLVDNFEQEDFPQPSSEGSTPNPTPPQSDAEENEEDGADEDWEDEEEQPLNQIKEIIEENPFLPQDAFLPSPTDEETFAPPPPSSAPSVPSQPSQPSLPSNIDANGRMRIVTQETLVGGLFYHACGEIDSYKYTIIFGSGFRVLFLSVLRNILFFFDILIN